MAAACEQCEQFRSQSGLLVRAFECEGNWTVVPAATLVDANALDLPIERFGPGHDSTFYPPTHGASLLALARANSSNSLLSHFSSCAWHEMLPPIQRDGLWRGTPGPRPTSLLQAGNLNLEYATYANSFGLTLRDSTRVVGAHAFDAWTTKPKPFCEDEDQQAVLRLTAVSRFCNNVSTSISVNGDPPLRSNRLKKWPAHAALSRMVASSAANCRFKTTTAMLQQQKLYRLKLRASGLLSRCPHARYAGAISQVAAVYDTSDVTGIFVLDWVPSHLPLATLAFKSLPPWRDESQTITARRQSGQRRLKLVRFSRSHHHDREGHGEATCSCHELPA